VMVAIIRTVRANLWTFNMEKRILVVNTVIHLPGSMITIKEI